MSADEASIRRDLAACYRLVALNSWDDLTATHISARLPGAADEFLINPHGLLFEEITASSLVKVNHAGETLAPTPYPINPAGFVIHSAIHMARADAGCVIHLHTRDGMAVSALEEGLLPLTQQAILVMSELSFHDYEGVATDLDERVRLQRDLGQKNLMFLRNHGTLAVGRTVREAFRSIANLETACAAQVAALSMGRPLHFPDPHVAAEADRKFSRDMMAASAERNWPALLRKLDRESPGYAD
ncbi:class II aldolase/adducin family protein [Sphingomonas tagetis]|nr:class II aldolase/adducin family protein [Sphingomonas tagetis]